MTTAGIKAVLKKKKPTTDYQKKPHHERDMLSYLLVYYSAFQTQFDIQGKVERRMFAHGKDQNPQNLDNHRMEKDHVGKTRVYIFKLFLRVFFFFLLIMYRVIFTEEIK